MLQFMRKKLYYNWILKFYITVNRIKAAFRSNTLKVKIEQRSIGLLRIQLFSTNNNNM